MPTPTRYEGWTVPVDSRGRIRSTVTPGIWTEYGPTSSLGLVADRFPTFPAQPIYDGDTVDLHLLRWASGSNATAREFLASTGNDVTDPGGVLPGGHVIDLANLSLDVNHASQTIWMEYTVNSLVYYVDANDGTLARPAERLDYRHDWWGWRGLLVTIPSNAYHRTDWTNGLIAAIDASPEFPVEALAREAAHFTKARNDFHQAENTRTAVDELAPSVQSSALRSALLNLQQSSGLTCRDVEVESRRTAFARGVMAVIDRARTNTDEWSVQDDAMNLGHYVEAALAAVGGAEATEAMLRTLCTRMQDDLRSRTPVTFGGATGAAVGAAANGEEHATLTVHVHCLVMEVVGVPDPIDLTPAEKKRFRLRTDVPDTGIKVHVPDTLAGVPDRSVVALELTGSGDTPLQRRFDGQTAWHAWTNPTIGDLLVAGRNRTVWFRPEPEDADADA